MWDIIFFLCRKRTISPVSNASNTFGIRIANLFDFAPVYSTEFYHFISVYSVVCLALDISTHPSHIFIGNFHLFIQMLSI